MTRFRFSRVALAVAVWLAAHPSPAADLCPLPPNPVAPDCLLDINRSTLTEEDVDMDGFPDNMGSAGTFCTGDSPADCGALASEVGFDVVIPRPDVQDVTCTIGVEMWFMNGTCEQCLGTGVDSVTLFAGSQSDTVVKLVVADENGDICVCGSILTCTYSVETFCEDGSDGDGDGLIDDDDPDCCVDNDMDLVCATQDCDDNDPSVWSPSAEVTNLELRRVGDVARLGWDSQDGSVYDVVSGVLSDLRSAGDYLTSVCRTDDHQATLFDDTEPDPFIGDAYYYLVRAHNSCDAGSYGDSSLGADPRDDLDISGPCPYVP